MADKYVTMHPTANGVLDTSIDIYPNIKASHNILNDSGNPIEVQEKLVSGNNIRPIKVGSAAVASESLLGNTTLVIDFLSKLYPVGTIYTCTTTADITFDSLGEPICPIQTILGGSWLPIHDKFLFAAKKGTHTTTGDYFPGDTGGSKDAVAVSHSHNATFNGTTGRTTAAGTVNSSNVFSTKDMTGYAHFYNTSGSYERTVRNAGGICSTGVFGNKESAEFKMGSGEHQPVYLDIDASHVHEYTPAGSITVNNNNSESGVGKNMPPYLAVYAWVRAA